MTEPASILAVPVWLPVFVAPQPQIIGSESQLKSGNHWYPAPLRAVGLAVIRTAVAYLSLGAGYRSPNKLPPFGHDAVDQNNGEAIWLSVLALCTTSLGMSVYTMAGNNSEMG